MRLFFLFTLILLTSSCSLVEDQHLAKGEEESIDLVEYFYKAPKKDYSEILIEKPDRKLYFTKKEKPSEETLPKKEEKGIEEEQDPGEEAFLYEESKEDPGEPPELSHQEPLVEEEKEEPIKKEDSVEEKKKDFVFKPYYSAPLGSQGLFDELEEATLEGWRIAEMEDPSSYLGFTPSGWEVYPVWYYTSPDGGTKFYTLNFYE